MIPLRFSGERNEQTLPLCACHRRAKSHSSASCYGLPPKYKLAARRVCRCGCVFCDFRVRCIALLGGAYWREFWSVSRRILFKKDKAHHTRAYCLPACHIAFYRAIHTGILVELHHTPSWALRLFRPKQSCPSVVSG